MVLAGVAQGAERCGEKCCKKSPANEQGSLKELTRNPHAPDNPFPPSCHMAGLHEGFSVKNVLRAAPNLPACDDGMHACCHLGSKRGAVQALISKSSPGVNQRFSHEIMVSYNLTQEFFRPGETDLVVMERVLLPRAAPIALFLKNSSFIC